ncbi:MAG: ISAs1 family transposase [Phycisphaerae bacterium]|nr:ISAs1 family transposase [Saprospiraceae bacterium]
MKEDRVVFRSLIDSFAPLEDPRIDRKKLYPLMEIVFLSVCAVLSGFEEWDEVVDFGEEKLTWLRKYLPYVHGIPSHDTMNRVISLVDDRAFERCFIDWVEMSISLPEGVVIHLDGKALGRSATIKQQQTLRSKGGKGAIQVLHAWCSELQVCLGQYKTETKSNEIKAIPALLDMMEVSGCLVTIDAMGCQKAIVDKIMMKQADYLIGLKSNQESLSLAAFTAFDETTANPHTDTQADQNHGRKEVRNCRVLPATALPEWGNGTDWKGLKTLIEIRSERYVMASGILEKETRYYISSLMGEAAAFNRLVRSHWCIENQLHWSLDVQFGEDDSRKRTRNAAQNFSTIRKIALNLIKANPEKISVNRKRNKCAMSDSYREKMLGF